ncbi:MAG: efflux RND transporter periplasmic adaptor subunit [Proteobacteria bacterium]|nr:efflux RND transporter periplasmic adaptor subunit [Pseudomonadota bacterium]
MRETTPPSAPRRRRRHPCTVLALGVTLAACGPGATEPPPEVVRPVKILDLAGGGAVDFLDYPGQIAATQYSEMGFEVPGRVVEFPVDEGQPVTAGQVLARLDPRDFEAANEAALARLRASKAEYERVKALFDADVTSQQELDRAQRNYEVVQANVKTADKALEDTVLRAPFDGSVGKKLVKEFENVQAKQPVLIVQDLEAMELVVAVPERDFVRLDPSLSNEEATRRAQPRVTLSSVPDRAFPARIKEYSTAADPTTRTYTVTLGFAQPEGVSVLPGMTAKVTIRVAAERVAEAGLRIPSRAAQADEAGAAFVWVVDAESMRVSRRAVELGELAGGDVRVRSGLQGDEWLAVSGLRQLRDGMQVSRFQN